MTTADGAAGPDQPGEHEESRPGLALSTVLLLVVVAAAGLGLDQLSKAWAVRTLEFGVPHPLVGELLQLRRTANPGAAFSIATNATWVLTLIACGVIVATMFVARRLRSRPWACALGLLIGGALGNLTDRFLRAPGGGKGHVVDFLELPNWPIFNVADICIVSSAVLICILAFRGIGIDGSHAGSAQDVTDDPAEPTPSDADTEGDQQQHFDAEGEAGAQPRQRRTGSSRA